MEDIDEPVGIGHRQLRAVVVVLEVGLDEEIGTIDASVGIAIGMVIGALGSPFTRMIF